MPLISPKPVIVTKPIVQAQANKPVITTKSKMTFTGIRTLPGGMKQSHTVEVSDKSDDRLQLLPFQVHCNTCNYEAKVKSYGEALTIAKSHVGL